MALVKQVEVRSLDSFEGGMAKFFTPQTSHETMLVQVAAGAQDDLFVHRYQTDQLLVVRGSMVLVVLQDRRYRYIPLTDAQPTVVQIPPGVPHGAINPSNQGCVLVNAVLRHGAPYAPDYRPLRQPFPYDLAQAKRVLDQANQYAAA
ncbi:dTDP-4-dehydrorhamnose 3,5-epimerase [filamentous cyanobacterium LEGE 11480]|uniref:dTDP-4-dehydrorhamnose 3,5-epimerase n=1 Tax=Romeriopsis navalis LEGE 11480 TaxID=2777977 RepID=A0A928Z5B0_9CYAN|nr:dTDP-4-dehydrorhamnose 3,5-epimerase [Romeriopsis navalis]MBE9031070.1 dTDP-4-dehydrorhamnose 3,5-epimerase [Romeriopsis navalis LEGE 11480]